MSFTSSMELGPTPCMGASALNKEDNVFVFGNKSQTPKGVLSHFSNIASQGNSTDFSLNSISGDHNVILIESDETAFLKNDMELYRNLKNSQFGQAGILDTRTNLPRGLLILKIKNTDEKTLNDLLKINSLGTWKISCRLPEN